ncbi:two-component system response regulator [Candidatus Desantisbacteria bacterium CG2_30_40_21]|uniref:Two-component system response regulator n=4 Tax=unclassified Candidatus Desantisiibacteriota TaxID=3106372 RepID=A0A2M7P2R2_9BACT|nr:MAG: two-component system response regulator [Candidatus Desantisbacteria bacterium CG2_30_40_21]PIP39478.1 MAG: two-component system response regulator [Candidatus Desantisbacteria bacterium CG23_combo_of_CG06-09_8_20_14_all_40_23]PIY19931.1 MAG: two-component system response regulator [Candidatus Desantisbacteria bacterium CG_4_10_14_3_um_filter_40_18]PJB29402.1 MAG: two-component system response regulator [Candidatus Desantisbacteria bacterium CG_4_9_14_3_um_filter_40_11]
MKHKNARILIVNDSLFMRRILRKILTCAGYDVVGEATDGTIAVQRYRELKPDLVTMDIVLPDIEMNGIETLKWLISINPEVKIVMISAVGYEELINEVLSIGAKDFVVKPFKPEILIKTIQQVLTERS